MPSRLAPPGWLHSSLGRKRRLVVAPPGLEANRRGEEGPADDAPEAPVRGAQAGADGRVLPSERLQGRSDHGGVEVDHDEREVEATEQDCITFEKAESEVKYREVAVNSGLPHRGAFVAASAVIIETRRRARFGFTLLASVAIAAAFFFVAVTAFLLIFGAEKDRFWLEPKYWHVVSGTVFVYLAAFHLIANWRVWPAYVRRLRRLGQRGV